MWFVVLSLLLAAACGDDGTWSPPDARPIVYVTGCEDPLLWTSPAMESNYFEAELAGRPCTGAQYPVSTVALTGFDTNDDRRVAHTCWRVVDTTPGSGFETGQVITSDKLEPALTIAGFAKPVTLEARALRDDGAIMTEGPPVTFALDAATILEPDATGAIAVMTREAWAEQLAVHVAGQRIPTDEVVGATSTGNVGGAAHTLHRTSTGFVRTSWSTSGTTIEQVSLALGPGTRGRIARGGEAIVIDSELLLTGYDGAMPIVRFRIPLAAEPREIVGGYTGALLHVDGALVLYRVVSNTPMMETRPVGDGILLDAWGGAGSFFFDGTRFHKITTYPELSFDEALSFTPRAEDLAMLGTPTGVYHDVVFGPNGLLAKVDISDPRPGPRFMPAAALFGAGTHVGPVAADSSAYLVRRDDGTAVIYNVPYADYCDLP